MFECFYPDLLAKFGDWIYRSISVQGICHQIQSAQGLEALRSFVGLRNYFGDIQDQKTEIKGTSMRQIGIVLLAICVALILCQAIGWAQATNEWDNKYGAHWTLADRASTIPKKSEHITKFIGALSASGLEGSHNATVFTTPANSFDANLDALKTLQSRLKDIEGMDVRSFEYQTAIQQITAQEQGEAHAMIQEIEGCWWKEHHFFLWDWVSLVIIASALLFGVFGCALISEGSY